MEELRTTTIYQYQLMEVPIPGTAVQKTYKASMIRTKGRTYGEEKGSIDGLAQWYYRYVNPQTEDLTIEIHGDFHTTYPNQEHLSVEYVADGRRSGKMHMSLNEYGHFFQQPFAGAKKKPKRKRRKKRRTNPKKR